METSLRYKLRTCGYSTMFATCFAQRYEKKHNGILLLLARGMVDSALRFKGLGAEAVKIVTGLRLEEINKEDREYLYSTLSRASCMLTVIETPQTAQTSHRHNKYKLA